MATTAKTAPNRITVTASPYRKTDRIVFTMHGMIAPPAPGRQSHARATRQMTSHKAANLTAWDAAVLDSRRLVARAQKCRGYQFWDGFDHYDSSHELWDAVNGTFSYSSTYARFAAPSGLQIGRAHV